MPHNNWRVLILGSRGTLGGQLMKLYPEAVGWDREDIDVLDYPSLRAKIGSLGFTPDAIVNCVAFNDVDGAEDRPIGRSPSMPISSASWPGLRTNGRPAGPLQHQLRV